MVPIMQLQLEIMGALPLFLQKKFVRHQERENPISEHLLIESCCIEYQELACLFFQFESHFLINYPLLFAQEEY
jgi:hypothetical protein